MSGLHQPLVALAAAVLVAALTACSNRPSPSETPRPGRSDGRREAPTQRDPIADASPEVRVRLSALDDAGEAPLRITGRWVLERLDGGEMARGEGLTGTVRLRGAAAIADRPVPRGGALLRPVTDGDLTIGTRRYPGHLRVTRSVDGTWHAYVVMDLETYVIGVVPGEIPATFPREAQRTQAILARTYALSSVPDEARGAPIVVSDSGGDDQEYHGIPATAEHVRIAEDAVRSTRGLVILDGAQPLRAWYHSTCGGHTTDAATVFGVPPRASLSGVPCSWCTSSKYYRWTARLPADAVLRAARVRDPLQGFSVGDTDEAGRARSLRIRAAGKDHSVSAPAFRLRVGASLLRSCMLDSARLVGDVVEVTGRGWGHGVGLCQIGAKTLAEQSLLAEDILSTYYPGTRVVRLW